MTKEELRKSLDFVNEERERLQRELERKDNIIKKLKDYLYEEGTKILASDGTVRAMYQEDYNILIKIKELEERK